MPCNTPPPAVNPEHIEDHDEEEEDIIYDDDDIIELDVTDESMLSFEAHDEAVFCCNFNKTGSLVVSGGQDETAFVWNINDGDTVFECKGGHTDSVIAADFNHDSSLVATAGMDGIIEVWNVASKTKVWDHEITEITWISWHPNANFLFAGTTTGECWKWLVPDNSVCEVFASHGEGASTGLLISNG
ncbi:WD repeat-containing protein 55 homolog [Caerostris darwini]|uniref:WD repeat-containing protein 55 homolog n=1 Tax=Caerostris darwini TaxID=1538125 RepID=A0AAV4UCB7_9ARAC|nr:WD repeat-containing protein 55 homolog [Caerostris darwini]